MVCQPEEVSTLEDREFEATHSRKSSAEDACAPGRINSGGAPPAKSAGVFLPSPGTVETGAHRDGLPLRRARRRPGYGSFTLIRRRKGVAPSAYSISNWCSNRGAACATRAEEPVLGWEAVLLPPGEVHPAKATTDRSKSTFFIIYQLPVL